MILNGPVPPERQHQSQKNYKIFGLINGFSYTCLGETVIILLAVQLGCKNYVISTLGAMLYFGFLLLPLGKTMSAKVGAVRCQVYFWILRNIAALLVAASVPLYLYASEELAIAFMLCGSFLFYGARAAGIVVIQPLFGEITNRGDRSQFFAHVSAISYAAGFLTLAGIMFLLYWTHNSLWSLTGIVVAGSVAGIFSSRFLARLDETGEIIKFARKPIGDEFTKLWHNEVFRNMLFAGWIINLAVIMLIPISVLALKRGYGVSDTLALAYTMVNLGSMVLFSFLISRPIRMIGPRNFMILAYSVLLLTGCMWAFAPDQMNWVHISLVFLLNGACFISLINAMNVYFLEMIPDTRRVTASILVAVISGAGAGIVGMLCSGFLLELLHRHSVESGSDAVTLYRHYFSSATALMFPGLILIFGMHPMPIEKRLSKRSLFWSILFPTHFFWIRKTSADPEPNEK
ncbi:MAG: Major Facilitator Superfamily protein [Lentisphaerae bacterium ADurb.Bin242]|nr:MAG: Major Facilitator Superfamily protein [Lentisphaerae bacterium ADurb.Bin242]